MQANFNVVLFGELIARTKYIEVGYHFVRDRVLQ
jgi:hypothetical protein